MKSIVIVDDEPLARKHLRDLVSGLPDYEVVAEAGRLEKARRVIAEFSPDVLLLDIQLYGENGFDLLEDLPEKTGVIFVTAYGEYAVRAFEVNALDYLMKPVTPERLEAALARTDGDFAAQSDITRGGADDGLPVLHKEDVVYLQQGRKRWFEPLESITVICADGTDSAVLLKGARRIVMRRSLAEWEKFVATDQFMRIHESTIIRLDSVAGTSRRDDGSLSVRMREIPGVFIADARMAPELLQRLAQNTTNV